MKRTFKTALIALSILCMGGVTTSCDEETVAQLITIIGNLFNTGETYTYTGNATSQTLNGSTTTDGWRGTYINATDENPTGTYNFSGMQVSLNCSTTGTLTIPAYTEGAVTTSVITISGLTLTASNDQSYTTLEIGENGMIDGSLTYNNVTYTAANLYIAKAVATSNSLELEMTIYFQGDNDGDDYSKAINFNYAGTVAAQ